MTIKLLSKSDYRRLLKVTEKSYHVVAVSAFSVADALLEQENQ